MDIKQTLKELLNDSNEQVQNKVVDHLYQNELTRRTNAVLKVLEKIDELDSSYRKEAKPDVETFNEDGSKASQYYSKERTESLKKIRENKEKLEKALQKAFNSNDFSEVLNLGK